MKTDRILSEQIHVIYVYKNRGGKWYLDGITIVSPKYNNIDITTILISLIPQQY